MRARRFRTWKPTIEDPGALARGTSDQSRVDRQAAQVSTSLSPTIPARINPMQPRRSKVAGSPNSTMPRMTVPIGANAGPHRIRRSHRQRAHRIRQQHDGQRHRSDRGHTRPQPREAVRVLETDRPTDFEHSGHDQNPPSHHALPDASNIGGMLANELDDPIAQQWNAVETGSAARGSRTPRRLAFALVPSVGVCPISNRQSPPIIGQAVARTRDAAPLVVTRCRCPSPAPRDGILPARPRRTVIRATFASIPDPPAARAGRLRLRRGPARRQSHDAMVRPGPGHPGAAHRERGAGPACPDDRVRLAGTHRPLPHAPHAGRADLRGRPVPA